MSDLELQVQELNLVKALETGLVDWFQYFELWQKLHRKE